MKQKILNLLLLLASTSALLVSCQKEIDRQPGASEEVSASTSNRGHLKQTKTYSSDVLFRWIDFQLSLNKTSPVTGLNSTRLIAFTGIGAYESVVPGMPAYQSLSGQLQDLADLPQTQPGLAYHWPASLNAAVGYITTALFPFPTGGKPVQDQAIKDFRDGLYNEFLSQGADAELLNRSAAFGEAVAAKIVACAGKFRDNWPTGWQGWPNLNPAVGTEADFDMFTGSWVRTSSADAAGPYVGHTRLLVSGSLNGIQLAKPTEFEYSPVPGSPFWNMAESVYSNSYDPHGLSLEERKAIAFYYGFPGYGGGHYLSIIKQALVKTNAALDVSALVLAKTGIAMEDAVVGCFQAKYDSRNYVVRPVTYIRKVMGDASFVTNLGGTPNHPEYPSGHSTLAGAMAETLTQQFGDNFSFTDQTFVNFSSTVNLAPRNFSSFFDFAQEIGESRVYGQIHYPRSCEDGKVLGKKVAQNVLGTIKFLKE